MRSIMNRDKTPRVHPSAWVAPTATLIGDVSVGAGSAISFGAVVAAESGPVNLGRNCVVMEHAVLRGVSRHPLDIGDNVLIGPHAHLTGCRIESEVFIATGACVFNGAVVETTGVVRIHGIVHVRSRLRSGASVPVGWIAIGDPAEILPPTDVARFTDLMSDRDFSGTVFGTAKGDFRTMTSRYAAALRRGPGAGSPSRKP